MKRIVALLLTLLLLCACFAGCAAKSASTTAPAASNSSASETPASAQTPAAADAPAVTLRIAHQSAETENIAKAFVKFKEELEAANVGFEVTIFPAGQLVTSDRDSIESVTLGEIDMTSVAEVQFASTVPAFYLFNAEFLFDSIDDAYATFYTEGLFDQLADATRQASVGCELSSVFANGSRALWTRGRAVHTVADFKGLELRCAENEINIAEMTALGAVPVTMAWNEIFTGLQQGTVSGLFSTKNAIVQQGFTAALDYCIDTNHSFGHALTLVNSAKLASLTEAQRAAFDAAMQAATEYEWELARESEAAIDAEIEGLVDYVHLTDAERAEIRDVMVAATEPLVENLMGDSASILRDLRK